MNESIDQKICEDMQKITEYLRNQKLILNFKKTNFIIFHSIQVKTNDPSELHIKRDVRNRQTFEEYKITRVK